MELVIKVVFYFSGFLIFWAMIGYPISLKIIDKILKRDALRKDYSYNPTVTLMIVAHNEEKVIKDKLENVIKLEYDFEKLKILVSSDNSTDKTNEIVTKFIEEHQDINIKLYETKERKGKTNAQNEAVKIVNSEILIMTDANAMLKKNSIKELVASFSSEEIVYVTGILVYENSNNFETSHSETKYWDLDTSMREAESRIQTITAGNGALYACRTNEYHYFNPIKCHDSAMPLYYALNKKKAIANHNAVAYEKAGENIQDEFKRKVRMSRMIIEGILPDIRILNFFKYKWFTYFYLGHRTCRYTLWLNHIILLFSNLLLLKTSTFYDITLVLQYLFYLSAILKHIFKIEGRTINMIYYYCITILAQLIGVYNIITGKTKPFWDKAESTR